MNNSSLNQLNQVYPTSRLISSDSEILELSSLSRNGQLGYCNNSNYFNDVIASSIEDRLPAENSLVGRTINYLTHVYDLINQVRSDLCTGRLKSTSAREVVQFITRSSSTLIAIAGGVKLTLLGSLLGAAGTLAGAATGIGLLVVLPPLAGKLGDSVIDLGRSLLSRTKEFLSNKRTSQKTL